MSFTLKTYNKANLPTEAFEQEIASFLFENLQQYGDPIDQIQKCMDYALEKHFSFGGKIYVVTNDENKQIAGVSIVNHTGMSGYIPENILVYIATDKNLRGKGVGKMIVEAIVNQTEGDIALHVDKENPAIKLYEKYGFVVKYLEMRKIK